MRRDRPATPEEIALFKRAMKDATPRARPVFTPEAVGPALAKPAPSKTAHPAPRRSAAPVPQPIAEAPRPLALDATAGIDKRTAERFRRGALPIEATLDLHGLGQAEARPALDGFLARCHARGFRAVLVVTGKGRRSDHGTGPGTGYLRGEMGVLRAALPHWLNDAGNRHRVLAVATAQPKHGGQGAFYVLLKRHRPGRDKP